MLMISIGQLHLPWNPNANITFFTERSRSFLNSQECLEFHLTEDYCPTHWLIVVLCICLELYLALNLNSPCLCNNFFVSILFKSNGQLFWKWLPFSKIWWSPKESFKIFRGTYHNHNNMTYVTILYTVQIYEMFSIIVVITIITSFRF